MWWLSYQDEFKGNLSKWVTFYVVILILKMKKMQRFQHIILYDFRKGKNPNEKKNCAVYGECAVTDPTCQKWFSGFPCWSSGKESTLQCKGPQFHP